MTNIFRPLSEIGRLATYHKYSDLTDAELPISARDIERLNGWLKMANISYLGSNKNEVVEGGLLTKETSFKMS